MSICKIHKGRTDFNEYNSIIARTGSSELAKIEGWMNRMSRLKMLGVVN
jgi:hypothetical protein